MTPGNNSIEIKKNVDVVPTRTDAQSELKEAASLHNLKKEVVVAPEKQNILFTNADVVNSTVTEKDVDAFEKNITQDSQNK
ncbi:hypothetical protein KA478_02905 [Patescibacteria group bacterium]|nr:hypothetical protein [Patescibacteria group bacterium]